MEKKEMLMAMVADKSVEEFEMILSDGYSVQVSKATTKLVFKASYVVIARRDVIPYNEIVRIKITDSNILDDGGRITF